LGKNTLQPKRSQTPGKPAELDRLAVRSWLFGGGCSHELSRLCPRFSQFQGNFQRIL